MAIAAALTTPGRSQLINQSGKIGRRGAEQRPIPARQRQLEQLIVLGIETKQRVDLQSSALMAQSNVWVMVTTGKKEVLLTLSKQRRPAKQRVSDGNNKTRKRTTTLKRPEPRLLSALYVCQSSFICTMFTRKFALSKRTIAPSIITTQYLFSLQKRTSASNCEATREPAQDRVQW